MSHPISSLISPIIFNVTWVYVFFAYVDRYSCVWFTVRSHSGVVLDWLAKESQDLPMFTFPELALQGCATMLSNFVEGPGDGTQVLIPAWWALF